MDELTTTTTCLVKTEHGKIGFSHTENHRDIFTCEDCGKEVFDEKMDSSG